jgi:3-deoxy-7-phosphoheptulonate synthase
MQNINIHKIDEITTPEQLKNKFKQTELNFNFIQNSRKTITDILNGKDKRKIVIVGPCSIHDYQLTITYTNFLKTIQTKFEKNIFIVMRMYFEKPRTINGWKGFIYDPFINETNNIEEGLNKTRQLLLEVTNMEIPIGTEFLDTIIPQYIDDLITWGCIGARTTESQLHRQLASGMSMPIGFKNSTSGNIKPALNACKSAEVSHSFLGINTCGKVSVVHTSGNKNTCLVLRGGENIGNNINIENILSHQKVFIDLSHDNTIINGSKDYTQQIENINLIKNLNKERNILNNIKGIMIESNIKESNQTISSELKYGISITDKCLNIDDTEKLILNFYNYLEDCNN